MVSRRTTKSVASSGRVSCWVTGSSGNRTSSVFRACGGHPLIGQANRTRAVRPSVNLQLGWHVEAVHAVNAVVRSAWRCQLEGRQIGRCRPSTPPNHALRVQVHRAQIRRGEQRTTVRRSASVSGQRQSRMTAADHARSDDPRSRRCLFVYRRRGSVGMLRPWTAAHAIRFVLAPITSRRVHRAAPQVATARPSDVSHVSVARPAAGGS
jgi:hypothetical protein